MALVYVRVLGGREDDSMSRCPLFDETKGVTFRNDCLLVPPNRRA